MVEKEKADNRERLRDSFLRGDEEAQTDERLLELLLTYVIPDEEFHNLVENEAKRPEPAAAHVGKAFETFLRFKLRGKGLIVLSSLEMLFAYHLELNLLRTMAADDDRILLLLPGRRGSGKIIMFPELEGGNYTLPTNLIASDHLWDLRPG